MLLIPAISVFDQLANRYTQSAQYQNDFQKLMQSGMSRKDAKIAAAAEYLIATRKRFEANDGQCVEFKLMREVERLSQVTATPIMKEGVAC